MPRLFDPLKVPIPQRRSVFDPVEYGKQMASPFVAGQQAQEKVYGALANLPGQIFGGLEAGQKKAQEAERFGLEKENLKADTEKKKAEAANKLNFASGTKTQLRSIGNQVVKITMDQRGDITNMMPLGLNPQTEMRVRTAVKEFSTAESFLNQIEELSSKIITSTGPTGAFSQYAGNTLGALSKASPEAATYLGIRKAFLAQMARASGENGVLTDNDLSRIENGLPSEGDTIEIARSKVATFRGLYQSTRDASVDAYTKPLSELTKKSPPNKGNPPASLPGGGGIEGLGFKKVP